MIVFDYSTNVLAGLLALKSAFADDRGEESRRRKRPVVRFYEWAGKDGEITLQLPAGAQAAVDTDLMEKPMGDAALHEKS